MEVFLHLYNSIMCVDIPLFIKSVHSSTFGLFPIFRYGSNAAVKNFGTNIV